MSIIIIDNFDSFTYNLVHIVEQFTSNYKVVRVNQTDIKEVSAYDKILISPGPGLPNQNNILKEIIKRYSHKSILGVCLGHQAIAEAFGGNIFNLSEVNHGIQKKTIIVDKDESLFRNISVNFMSGRYHSWAVKKENLPDVLKVTAIDDNDVIMGISHKTLDIKGIQFHPESILTPSGKIILENWIRQK